MNAFLLYGLPAVVVIALLIWYFFMYRTDKLMPVVTPQNRNRILFTKALRQLNSKVTWKKDKEKEEWEGIFDYQSGHFRVRLTEDTPYLQLMYLFFYETDFPDLELVREICNLCNKGTETSRLVYSIDEKQGTVDVHILNGLYLPSTHTVEALQRTLNEIFSWQNTFTRRYNETKSESDDMPGRDHEKSTASISRELYMLHEMEMKRQVGQTEWHSSEHSPHLLRQLLAATFNMTDIVPARLVRFSEDGKVVVADDPDKILDFHYADCLICNNRWISTSALLCLEYYDPRRPARLRRLIINLGQEGQTAETFYYRATLTRVPLSADRMAPADAVETDALSRSVLLGYDLEPVRQADKFQYIWKEAEAKQKAGSTEKLTDDERLLLSLKDAHLGLNVYRGKQLFLQRRYYEALLLLEDAYRHIIRMPVKALQAAHSVYFEVCYLVGFCYSQLHQYERASYYLEFTLPLHRVNYTEAYVNNLVASGDIRSLNIIDSLLSQVIPSSDDEDDGEDGEDSHSHDRQPMQELMPFANFLRRSKTEVLIAQHRYKEAEALLQQLLTDPENTDFVLKELAHIKKLKEKNE